MKKSNILDQAFFSVQKALKASLHKFISNPQDIEDVVQETYLRAVASNTSKTIENPEAYLFRASRNIAINQQSRMYRQLESVLADDEMEIMSALMTNCENGIERDYQTKQKFAEFCLAVSELPIKCRKVFVLRKVYGYSQAEIAKKLGISVSTVETHITKGMHRTKLFMDEQHDSSDTQVLGPNDQVKERSDG